MIERCYVLTSLRNSAPVIEEPAPLTRDNTPAACLLTSQTSKVVAQRVSGSHLHPGARWVVIEHCPVLLREVAFECLFCERQQIPGKMKYGANNTQRPPTRPQSRSLYFPCIRSEMRPVHCQFPMKLPTLQQEVSPASHPS